MPSPRTDPRDWLAGWRSVDRGRIASLADRLNVRLISSIALVALVGLVVSGAALSQILPGFFAEQSRERTETAMVSTGIFLGLAITSVGEAQPDVVMDRRLRDELVVAPIAAATAEVFDATVTIINSRNETVARAEPVDREALEAEGFDATPMSSRSAAPTTSSCRGVRRPPTRSSSASRTRRGSRPLPGSARRSSAPGCSRWSCPCSPASLPPER